MTSHEMAQMAAEGIAKKILTVWLELRLLMSRGENGQVSEARRLYREPPRVIEVILPDDVSAGFQAARGTRLYRIAADDPELQRMLSSGELWEVPPGHLGVVLNRIQSLPQELEQTLVEVLNEGG